MDAITKSKRTALPIKQKFDIIQDLSEAGATQSNISLKYGVPRSSVTKIWKNKDEIIHLFHDEDKLNLKRARSANYIDVDQALFEWFKQKVPQGARISRPILIEKAKQLAAADGEILIFLDFTPTTSWIQRWRGRHVVVWKKEEGEKQDADIQSADEWIQIVLPHLLQQFWPHDIFNADETGLYFRGFPERGYGLKNENLCGGKKAKDRITVLVCANMTGDEKRPLLVIGKSKKPRCFPKDLSNLPVFYRHSTNAWMTSDLFREWLEMWDQQLRLKQRKILLLVDNFPAHPKITTLVNVTLRFLPPNTTSLIQSMDMGVTRHLKGFYRSKLNSRIITALDADENVTALEVSRSVSVLDALYLIRNAWLSVKVDTIRNCYKKGGFRVIDEVAESFNQEDDFPIPERMTIDDFQRTIEMDSDLEVAGELNDTELIELVRSKRHQLGDSNSDSDELEIIELSSKEEPNLKKVLEAFHVIRSYAQDKGEDVILLNRIEEILRDEISQTKKQSKIESYYPQ